MCGRYALFDTQTLKNQFSVDFPEMLPERVQHCASTTSSLMLDNLVGTDLAGYAGLEDGVDWYWNRLFTGAVLTAPLGVGAELAALASRTASIRSARR